MDKKNSIYKCHYSLHLEAFEKVSEYIALQIRWGDTVSLFVSKLY